MRRSVMSSRQPERREDADKPTGRRRIRIDVEEPGAEDPQGAEPSGDDEAEQAPGARAEEERAVPEHATVELSHSEYAELKTLARERDEFYRRLQRAVADYQNLQKRVDKFRDSARESILRNLGDAILPVADSLALALEAAEQTEGGEGIVEGLRLVEKDFYGALARLNILPIEAEGQPFDPHFHEALFRQPTDQAEPNTVLREMKRGFVMRDLVLRPSQVIVAGEPQAGQQ
jgi:molecular chaperone GrpE